MTPGVEFGSAEIIPFPVRSGRRKAETGKVAGDTVAQLAAAALDTCWYHDEAVRDTSPPPVRD